MSDEQFRTNAAEELYWDPRVDADAIIMSDITVQYVENRLDRDG